MARDITRTFLPSDNHNSLATRKIIKKHFAMADDGQNENQVPAEDEASLRLVEDSYVLLSEVDIDVPAERADIERLINMVEDQMRHTLESVAARVIAEFAVRRARIEGQMVREMIVDYDRAPPSANVASAYLALRNYIAAQASQIETDRRIGYTETSAEYTRRRRLLSAFERTAADVRRRVQYQTEVAMAPHDATLQILHDVLAGRTVMTKMAFDLMRLLYNDPTYTKVVIGYDPEFYHSDLDPIDPNYYLPRAGVFAAWFTALAKARYVTVLDLQLNETFITRRFAAQESGYFNTLQNQQRLPALREDFRALYERAQQARGEYEALQEEYQELMDENGVKNMGNYRNYMESLDDDDLEHVRGMEMRMDELTGIATRYRADLINLQQAINDISAMTPPEYPRYAFDDIFVPLASALARNHSVEDLTIGGVEVLGGVAFDPRGRIPMSQSQDFKRIEAVENFLQFVGSSRSLRALRIGRVNVTLDDAVPITDFVTPIVERIETANNVADLSLLGADIYGTMALPMVDRRFEFVLSALAQPDSSLLSLRLDAEYSTARFEDLCRVLRDENQTLRRLSLNVVGDGNMDTEIVATLFEHVRDHPKLQNIEFTLIYRVDDVNEIEVREDVAHRTLAAVRANRSLVTVDVLAMTVRREFVAKIDRMQTELRKAVSDSRLAPFIVGSLQALAMRAITATAEPARSQAIGQLPPQMRATAGRLLMERALVVGDEYNEYAELYDFEILEYSDGEFDRHVEAVLADDTDDDDEDYGYDDEEEGDQDLTPPRQAEAASSSAAAPSRALVESARFSDPEDEFWQHQFNGDRDKDDGYDYTDDDDEFDVD
jgi:hypothetical protein